MSKFDGLLQKKNATKAGTVTIEGRPPGKATDPAYRQVTIYIRRETHTAARKRLLDDNVQFSELVEQLVTQWLAKPEIKRGKKK